MENINFKQGTAKQLINGINSLPTSLRGYVSSYNPKEYKAMNCKIFIAEDEKSGFAVKPDGELISVFSTVRGRGEAILAYAVQAGAKKLDCYKDESAHLVNLYSKFGFRVVESMKWDDQYAPKTWNYTVYGRPDVVIMAR